MNVIVGLLGVGKTFAARQYCQHANTWMVTLSPGQLQHHRVSAEAGGSAGP